METIGKTTDIEFTHADQIKFRLDQKTNCMNRAIEDCRYDDANIFAAQADYYTEQLEKLTGQKGLIYNFPEGHGRRTKI